MQVPFVDLQAQHAPLQDELNQAIQRVISKTHFVLGEDVAVFEKEFAAYCGTQFAVGLDSGLSALQMALLAFDIGPGDEVIVPANTFIATAGAVTFSGALPVLVDMDPNTYQIDTSLIEKAITPRTKAIIPVHLYGLLADMDAILDIANRHNLIVIEDACQAHGASYKGQRAGSMGHAGAFSCYPAKNLGAAGDAGILVTNDAQIAERVRILRNCGSKEKYYHLMAPHNHRLDTLQAAILSVKLKYLDGWNAARQQHAALYNSLLADSGVQTPPTLENTQPVWHLYVIRTDHRDELKDYLSKQGIGVGIHYPVPIHLQPFYANLGYTKGSFPVTEDHADHILSLPMFAELTNESIEYVVEHIKQFTALKQADGQMLETKLVIA